MQAELKKMQQNMRIDNKLEKELDDSDIEELASPPFLCVWLVLTSTSYTKRRRTKRKNTKRRLSSASLRRYGDFHHKLNNL